jgi:hypothetical protein
MYSATSKGFQAAAAKTRTYAMLFALGLMLPWMIAMPALIAELTW